MGFDSSLFRKFEIFLENVVRLDENDVRLLLKQYISNLVTYKTDPGIYTVKGISEAVYTKSGHDELTKVNMMI